MSIYQIRFLTGIEEIGQVQFGLWIKTEFHNGLFKFNFEQVNQNWWQLEMVQAQIVARLFFWKGCLKIDGDWKFWYKHNFAPFFWLNCMKIDAN